MVVSVLVDADVSSALQAVFHEQAPAPKDSKLPKGQHDAWPFQWESVCLHSMHAASWAA